MSNILIPKALPWAMRLLPFQGNGVCCRLTSEMPDELKFLRKTRFSATKRPPLRDQTTASARPNDSLRATKRQPPRDQAAIAARTATYLTRSVSPGWMS